MNDNSEEADIESIFATARHLTTSRKRVFGKQLSDSLIIETSKKGNNKCIKEMPHTPILQSRHFFDNYNLNDFDDFNLHNSIINPNQISIHNQIREDAKQEDALFSPIFLREQRQPELQGDVETDGTQRMWMSTWCYFNFLDHVTKRILKILAIPLINIILCLKMGITSLLFFVIMLVILISYDLFGDYAKFTFLIEGGISLINVALNCYFVAAEIFHAQVKQLIKAVFLVLYFACIYSSIISIFNCFYYSLYLGGSFLLILLISYSFILLIHLVGCVIPTIVYAFCLIIEFFIRLILCKLTNPFEGFNRINFNENIQICLISIKLSQTDCENLQKKIVCAICLDDFQVGEEVCQLECHITHIFHRYCMVEWAKAKIICPTCRSRINCCKDFQKI